MPTRPKHIAATMTDVRGVRPPNRRRAVAATLSLLDDIAHRRLDWLGLCAWIDAQLVVPGYLAELTIVRERTEERSVRFPVPGAVPDEKQLQWMLTVARRLVVDRLRRLAGPDADDHFLLAAIHLGRVLRISEGHETAWVPRLGAGDTLSDWVISYVAADVLTHREEYERDLEVCGRCGQLRLRSLSATEHQCASRQDKSTAPPRSRTTTRRDNKRRCG